MKFQPIDPLKPIHLFFSWRKARKSSWRRRFAYLPLRLGLDGRFRGDFIWLEKYWLQGRYMERTFEYSKHGGMFGGPTFYSHGGFWMWTRSQGRPT